MLSRFPECFLQLRFNGPWTVSGSSFETEQRQFSLFEQVVQEFVSLSPVGSPMRGIVQFNCC
jgi:hypothetical protein